MIIRTSLRLKLKTHVSLGDVRCREHVPVPCLACDVYSLRAPGASVKKKANVYGKSLCNNFCYRGFMNIEST